MRRSWQSLSKGVAMPNRTKGIRHKWTLQNHPKEGDVELGVKCRSEDRDWKQTRCGEALQPT